VRTNSKQIAEFKLNISLDMSKMHYFSYNFFKIAKRWGLSAPSAVSSCAAIYLNCVF